MTATVGQRSLVLVCAGISQPSSTRLLGDRMVAAATSALADRGIEPQVRVIEVRDLAHDLVDAVMTGFPGGGLRLALEAVRAADGLVAVSPVYNGSFSGLFKLFFDSLERGSLRGRPLAIGATGGTPRHSLALDFAFRPMFAYLGASAVPTAVFAASADWGAGADGDEPALATRVERAGRELAEAIAGRVSATGPDPFDRPTAFDDLLSGRARPREQPE
jgi:FMN reductase